MFPLCLCHHFSHPDGYLKVVLFPSHSGGFVPNFDFVEREWSRIRKPERSFGPAISSIPVVVGRSLLLSEASVSSSLT